jgi:hypothetical protein
LECWINGTDSHPTWIRKSIDPLLLHQPVPKMEPAERLALSWGINARQFTKLLLSLLSHAGGKKG